MKRIAIASLVFIAVASLLAALAWIGGYNFDTRGVLVAYWTGLGLAISAILAIGAYFCTEETP